MVKLPTYKGYTFDFGLQEIRCVSSGEPIKFISFESESGMTLLDAFFDDPETIDEFDRYDAECQFNGYPRPWIPNWYLKHRKRD